MNTVQTSKAFLLAMSLIKEIYEEKSSFDVANRQLADLREEYLTRMPPAQTIIDILKDYTVSMGVFTVRIGELLAQMHPEEAYAILSASKVESVEMIPYPDHLTESEKSILSECTTYRLGFMKEFPGLTSWSEINGIRPDVALPLQEYLMVSNFMKIASEKVEQDMAFVKSLSVV